MAMTSKLFFWATVKRFVEGSCCVTLKASHVLDNWLSIKSCNKIKYTVNFNQCWGNVHAGSHEGRPSLLTLQICPTMWTRVKCKRSSREPGWRWAEHTWGWYWRAKLTLTIADHASPSDEGWGWKTERIWLRRLWGQWQPGWLISWMQKMSK